VTMSTKPSSSSSSSTGASNPLQKDDALLTTISPATTEQCPYLDTITRTLLDFDFEHSCSVSLSSGPHIYGCLVCGTFFRGRGPQTPAHIHSVESGHAVYVHLSKGTFHCLPDDYEIVGEASLQDVGDALRPVFSGAMIKGLDRCVGVGVGAGAGVGVGGISNGAGSGLSRDLLGRMYLPGFVGLNNLKKTDCINATLQALAHVRPLRDFFLRCGSGDIFEVPLTTIRRKKKKKKRKRKRDTNNKRKRNDDYDNDDNDNDDDDDMTTTTALHKVDPTKFSHLAQCFGELIRKMWSDRRFKSTVDPHMLVQAVSVASHKRFTIGKQAEAGEFIAWLLHQVHLGIGGTRRPGSSIVHQVFQGIVGITTRQRLPPSTTTTNPDDPHAVNDDDTDDDDGDDRIGSGDEEETHQRDRARLLRRTEALRRGPQLSETTADTHFLQLTLDIPEKPLFKDDDGGLVIPQEPLVSVLKKFDGVSFLDALDAQTGRAQKRRYRLKRLPGYLVLHLTRFRRNGFYNEKNPTIVAFPVKNLDLGGYVHDGGEGAGKDKVPTEEDIDSMTVKQLKALLTKHHCADLAQNTIEKSELITTCKNFITSSLPDLLAHKYDLVANITHTIPAEVGREGQHDPLDEGSYRCHVQHKGSGQWYEMQDLHVQKIMPQQIGLSESYVLIFEKKGQRRL